MKSVSFGFGLAVKLASRTLTITRMSRAGDDSAITPIHDADAGSTATSVSVALTDNTMWQAKLVDISDSGVTSVPDILNFHTGSLQFPGPRSEDRLTILSMEELSSSSSSSSTSEASSSSHSSLSVSSSSSSSSSSFSHSASSYSRSTSSSSFSSWSLTSSSSSTSSASSSSSSSSQSVSSSTSSASSSSSHSSSSWSA